MNKNDKPGQGNRTEKRICLVTAEAVRRGHPDKLCDQIADALLDAHLRQDPNSRVALEVMAAAGKISIAGEVTSRARLEFLRVVEGVLRDIGYRHEDLCQDGERLELEVSVHEQSPDIAFAVDGRYPDSDLGAGDQGILVGYATDETSSRMPRACVIAQKICRLLDEEAKRNPMLGVDGKAQVTLRYEGERVYAHTIVVSAQHSAGADERELRDLISQIVRSAVGRADMWTTESRLLVNPSGRFVLGGQAGGHRAERAQAGSGSVRPRRAHRRRRAVRQGRHQGGSLGRLRRAVDRPEPGRGAAVQALRSAAGVCDWSVPPGVRDRGQLRHLGVHQRRTVGASDAQLRPSPRRAHREAGAEETHLLPAGELRALRP